MDSFLKLISRLIDLTFIEQLQNVAIEFHFCPIHQISIEATFAV